MATEKRVKHVNLIKVYYKFNGWFMEIIGALFGRGFSFTEYKTHLRFFNIIIFPCKQMTQND